jgi:hypothetical protein
MAITDYASLQDAASRWAGGSSDALFADAIRDAIDMVESELDRELRIPEMITRVAATLDEPYETLPGGVVKMISVSRIVDGVEKAPQLQPVSEDHASALAALHPTGTPRWYSLVSTQLRVIPSPSTASPCIVRAVYYGQVPRLSADIPCTAVLLAARDAYLYGTLSHLGEYVEDAARLARFDARFRNAIRSLNRAAVGRDATLAA